jgi:ribosomal protein L24
VIAGDDKGAVGEVEKVLTKRGLVVIKGVNIKVGPAAGT